MVVIVHQLLIVVKRQRHSAWGEIGVVTFQQGREAILDGGLQRAFVGSLKRKANLLAGGV